MQKIAIIETIQRAHSEVIERNCKTTASKFAILEKHAGRFADRFNLPYSGEEIAQAWLESYLLSWIWN